MVAFLFPEGRSVDINEGGELDKLGLGWCTIVNGVIQADHALNDDEIAKIEAAGFKRADTHWYEISPEPSYAAQGSLLSAIGQRPSTTIAPHTDGNSALQVAFLRAASAEEIAAVKALGLTLAPIEKPSHPGLRYTN